MAKSSVYTMRSVQSLFPYGLQTDTNPTDREISNALRETKGTGTVRVWPHVEG